MTRAQNDLARMCVMFQADLCFYAKNAAKDGPTMHFEVLLEILASVLENYFGNS